MKTNHQSGFSLVEVMLAMLIMAVVMMGISSIIVNESKQETKIKAQQQFFNAQQQLLYENKAVAPP